MRSSKLPVALLLVLAACTSSTAVISTGGSYRLETIDDASLPYTVNQPTPNDRLDVTGGQIDLFSDSTYQDVIAYDVVTGGTRTTRVDKVTGVWHEKNGEITFEAMTPTNRSYTAQMGVRTLVLFASPDGWPPGARRFVYTR